MKWADLTLSYVSRKVKKDLREKRLIKATFLRPGRLQTV